MGDAGPAMALMLEETTPAAVRETPPTGLIKLSDGRWLAYAEWGDPNGVPVIHQHGMPGSRFDHEADREFYRSIGVRVITPDRPGYGLSSRHPGSHLLDWPRDVAELADTLGLRRFGITALSGGGIYALACAAAIPDRLTDVVVTGCPAPMHGRAAFLGMRFTTRAGVWLAANAPWLVEALAWAVAPAIRRYPRFFVENSNRDKPAPDLRWMSMAPVKAGATATIREAFHSGGWGYAHDLRMLATPWGFRPEAIQVPVQLWSGDEDTVIPPQHSEYLAAAIPNATLRVCPGEAHMLLWNHLGEILMAAAGMGATGPGAGQEGRNVMVRVDDPTATLAQPGLLRPAPQPTTPS
jgi:pimeloyl-ACP methyl ester carboxylesterase